MASPIITNLSTLDKFFFYFFLPALVVFAVSGNRLYFKSKKKEAKVFKLTRDLIFGNILVTFLGFGIALFFYFYILELNLLEGLQWELLTIVGFIFLSFPLGIGVGAHVVGVSIRKLLDPKDRKLQEAIKAVHFFHYSFSHNVMFSSVVLMAYLLAILDFFKGRSLDLDWLLIGLIIVSGVILGSVFGILFIITKSQKLILHTTLIVLISLEIMTLGESRTLIQHPVTFLFFVACLTVTIGILLYRQTRINLRPPVKRAVKKWLQWDIDYL